MDVAAIIVGDEVLSGHVVDANGPASIAAIAKTGHRVHRVVTVGDDVATIAREIRTALDDGCRLVLTSGGLGPTHDDVTLEGVAAGLGLELTECVAMRDRIERWIERAGAAGVDEAALGASWLRRMALAPQGATLIECAIPVPAFAIPAGGATVAVLPGPPAQFAAALEAVLVECLDAPPEIAIEEVRHPYPESMLAQVLADLAIAHAEISIGSYPVADGVLLRLKGPAERVALVRAAIIDAIAILDDSPHGAAMRAVLAARTRSS